MTGGQFLALAILVYGFSLSYINLGFMTVRADLCDWFLITISSKGQLGDLTNHHHQPTTTLRERNDFLWENRCHWRQRTPLGYVSSLYTKSNVTGRLASIVAKQILNGQHIVVVRCEDLNISGEFFRNKLKFHAYLRKRCRYNPTRVRPTFGLTNVTGTIPFPCSIKDLL